MAPHMSSGLNYPSKREWLEIKQVGLNLCAATQVSPVFHWIDSSDCNENLPEKKKWIRVFGYSFNYRTELQKKSMSHSFKFAILEHAIGLTKPVPCLCELWRFETILLIFSQFPYRWIATVPSNCKMWQQLLLLLINGAASSTRTHRGAFEVVK